MFYTASPAHAFLSIMYINNEVYFGWWARLLHANGASWFFFIVYIHMFKGIYYGSFLYPRQLLWNSGVLIWLLMIPTAFFGYVLPWGQMSFWGAMVITSLLAAIPLIGIDVLFLLWGSFSIEEVTLKRFYSLHFALPFIILGVAILHFFFLHEFGSSNPHGLNSRSDNIPLFPYYGLKDFLSIVVVWVILLGMIFTVPDILNHPDNYNIANSMATPSHIVPEWYFLPLYAVLRSVRSKLFGFFLMICAVICLFLFPYFAGSSITRSSTFKPLHKRVFWVFVIVCLFLGWIGSLPIMAPYLLIVKLLLVYIFLLFVLYILFLILLKKLCMMSIF